MECGKKLKKLRNHARSKLGVERYSEKSQNNKQQEQCTLHLKPTKLDDTTLEPMIVQMPKKKHKHRKHKTKQNKVLTEDDIIRDGLQTVFELCGLLDKNEGYSILQQANKLKSKLATRNERNIDFKSTNHKSSKYQEYASEVQESQKPVIISKLPNVQNNKTTLNDTLTHKDVNAAEYRIVRNVQPLQRERNAESAVVEKYTNHYKSLHKSRSMISLSSYRQLTKEDSSPSLREESHGIERLQKSPNILCMSEMLHNEGYYKTSRPQQTVLSAKYFPPLEIVPCMFSEGCIPDYGSMVSDDIPDSESVVSQQSVIPPLSRASATAYYPVMEYRRECSIYSKSDRTSKKHHRLPDQAKYSEEKSGDNLAKSVKYSLVKISEFDEFSTYEIMKPSKKKPKNMSKSISEIFVVSRQQKAMSVNNLVAETEHVSFLDKTDKSNSTQIETTAIEKDNDADLKHRLSPEGSLLLQENAGLNKDIIVQPNIIHYTETPQQLSNRGENVLAKPRFKQFTVPESYRKEVDSKIPVHTERNQTRHSPVRNRPITKPIVISDLNQLKELKNQLGGQFLVIPENQIGSSPLQNKQINKKIILAQLNHARPAVQSEQIGVVYAGAGESFLQGNIQQNKLK